MSIGERYKEVRKILGYSQTDMAHRIGTSQSYYSNVERGTTVPTARHNKLFVLEFNVNPLWLESGEGEIFDMNPRKHRLLEAFEKLDQQSQEYLVIEAERICKEKGL